nr:YetF domain-containing protein [uncultured Porphyromonas sp.]
MLIKHGEVDVEACCRAKITAAEVAFKLRREGVYHVRDVKRAVFEQNGELIIVLRGEENPKYPIITDGIVQTSVLDDVDKTEEWLTEELQRAGYNSAAEIFLAEYENGELKLIPFVRASQAE